MSGRVRDEPGHVAGIILIFARTKGDARASRKVGEKGEHERRLRKCVRRETQGRILLLRIVGGNRGRGGERAREGEIRYRSRPRRKDGRDRIRCPYAERIETSRSSHTRGYIYLEKRGY